MRISFYSFSDDDTIRLEAEGNQNNNIISFYDKENVLVEYIIDEINGILEIRRTGQVNSSMLFKKGKKTISKYQTVDGLDIDFLVHCHSLNIEKNKIVVEYQLSLDDNIINNYKIWLLIH